MTRTLLAFALVLAAAPAARAQEFKYSEWDSWNAFGIGSTVTLEMESAGFKTKMTHTLTKKEAEKLTVETVTEVQGFKTQGVERAIEKAKAAAAGSAECPLCKKSHPGNFTSKADKLKIKDKDVEVTAVEGTAVDCTGKDLGTFKSWYSKDVPGGLVKMESKAATGETKMTATDYAAKK